jgi:outer membrane protein OmpA-like peptidoglycan-associated protein
MFRRDDCFFERRVIMKKHILFATVVSCLPALAAAQSTHAVPAAQAAAAAPEAAHPAVGAPAPLVLYFDVGSTTIRNEDRAVLDAASRAYNEGKPIVMILTGSSDRTGSSESNLTLSERRAGAVLKGLRDRGIPADRFQVLAKGETDLPVPTDQGVAELRNRRVEITWR